MQTGMGGILCVMPRTERVEPLHITASNDWPINSRICGKNTFYCLLY